MKLEVNLVSKQSIDSDLGSLIARERYSVNNDADVMSCIVNFIKDQSSTFAAAIKDPRLVQALSNVPSLTWTQLDCLRYILSSGLRPGLDIWYWMTADNEINSVEVNNGIFEYNVIDYNNHFYGIPMSSKLEQTQVDNSLITVYEKIIESYELFQGSIFSGLINPLDSAVKDIKSSIELMGKVPQIQSSNINYMLQFLHKGIKIIVA